MLILLQLLLATLPKSFRSRRHLLLENLLLRQQLQVALRPHPRVHLRVWDKLFWLLVRRSIRGGGVISFWSGRRLSSAGTARAGVSTGAGAPGLAWVGHV
jgi:hypothetical protein